MDTNDPRSTFAERLLDAIRSKKITQKELSQAIGTTERTVSRWMTKGIIPKHQTIQKAAKACGVSILWLEKGIGPKNIQAVWRFHAMKKNSIYMIF